MSNMMLKFFFIALNSNIEWALQSLPTKPIKAWKNTIDVLKLQASLRIA